MNNRLFFELRIFYRIRMRNTKLLLRLVMRFRTSKIFRRMKELCTLRKGFFELNTIISKQLRSSRPQRTPARADPSQNHGFASPQSISLLAKHVSIFLYTVLCLIISKAKAVAQNCLIWIGLY